MLSRSTATSEPLAAGWLAAIVESSDDAIVSKTLDGIITSWNPAAEKLFGYTAEEMIGRPIAILAAPDRENEMPAILERIRRGEKVDHYETVRRRKDGSLVDISLTVSPIRDETGRIVGASKIARDITERRRPSRPSGERGRFRTSPIPSRTSSGRPPGRAITFAKIAGSTSAASRRRRMPGVAGAGAAPDDRERCSSMEPRLRRAPSTRSRCATGGRRRVSLVPHRPCRGAGGRITAVRGATNRESRLKSASDVDCGTLPPGQEHVRRRAGPRGAECLQGDFGGRVHRGVSWPPPGAQRRPYRPDCRGLELGKPGIPGPDRPRAIPGRGDRIRLDVRDLRLNPDFALTLALGLNELATNAAKYGALASPTGHITLTARVEAGENGDEFRLVWQEDGGPAVDTPAVNGFGTSMLSQAIEYQHEGSVELDWRKEGLICRMTLPLAKAASSPDSRQ